MKPSSSHVRRSGKLSLLSFDCEGREEMSHLQEAPWCQVRLLQLVEVGHRREDSASPALLGKGVTSQLGDNMHRAGLDVLCFAACGQSSVPKPCKTSRVFFSAMGLAKLLRREAHQVPLPHGPGHLTLLHVAPPQLCTLPRVRKRSVGHGSAVSNTTRPGLRFAHKMLLQQQW